MEKQKQLLLSFRLRPSSGWWRASCRNNRTTSRTACTAGSSHVHWHNTLKEQKAHGVKKRNVSLQIRQKHLFQLERSRHARWSNSLLHPRAAIWTIPRICEQTQCFLALSNAREQTHASSLSGTVSSVESYYFGETWRGKRNFILVLLWRIH